MIPLAEANPDPGLPQLSEFFDNRLKFGINEAPSFEPEIKEITRDDKKIGRDGLLITQIVGPRAPSPKTVKKMQTIFKFGIGAALQVGVREKNRLHDGSLLKRFCNSRPFLPESMRSTIIGVYQIYPFPSRKETGRG